jgi:ABC-2 type transport system permease protein
MQGVFNHTNNLSNWTLSSVTSYYFLLIVAAAVLMTHPEIPIIRDDIEKGELAGRLLKPFSYYWQRFHAEIPVRIFQGIVGTLIFFLLIYLYRAHMSFHLSLTTGLLALIIIVFAYLICFTFKMILATTALWTTEIRGAQELTDIVIIVFAGYIVPVNLLPGILEKIAYLLPFAYIIYYPIIAVQGKLEISALISVISVQIVWLVLLSVGFRFLWRKGLAQYTDFGH